MSSFVTWMLLVILMATAMTGVGVLVRLLAAIRKNSNWSIRPSEFDPTKDVTTVLPVPLGASTCSHHWVVVSEQKLTTPHQERCVVILKCDSCGSIDKTVQVTSPPPPPPPAPPLPPQPKSECRHRWDREKTVTLDSAYEQMRKAEEKVPHTQFMKKASQLDATTIEPWMFRKTYISIRVCTHCGEVEKVIASNFTTEDEQRVEQEIDQAFESVKLKRTS